MNILLMQLAKMGDLLQTAPLVARLREAYAGCAVHLLHSEVFSAAAAHVGADACLPVNLDALAAGTPPQLRPGQHPQLDGLTGYDLLVNPGSNLLAEQMAARIPCTRRMGHGSTHEPSVAWLYFAMSFVRSRRLGTLNLVDIYRQIVPARMEQCTPGAFPTWAQCRLVGLQPASRDTKRQWPVEHYAALARRLLAQGSRLRLFGAASEVDYARRLLELLGTADGVENLVGRTGVDDLFTAVGQCDLLITGDTGTMHVAAAQGVPVLAVFLASAQPWETLAWGPGVRGVWPDADACPCYPCADGAPCTNGYLCHRLVSPEAVWALGNALNSAPGIALNSAPGNAPGVRGAATARENLGQVLAPWDGLREEEKLGLLYRAFARKHFLQDDTPGPEMPGDLSAELRRELTLLERLEPLNLPYDKLLPNFRLLLPLLYYRLVCADVPTQAPRLLLAHLRAAAGLPTS